MDGVYAAYMTGHAGVSMLMLFIKSNTITGVDIGGIKYDGSIRAQEGGFNCNVVYTIPAGLTIITGAAPASTPTKVPFSFTLPVNFANGQVIRLETPLGPVNARFERLRDIPV